MRLFKISKKDKSIGLISDAGTPGFAIPEKHWYSGVMPKIFHLPLIPGPSAWTMALALCPFSKERVQFLGFLPKKEEERLKTLASALMYRGTTIFYESPQRLVSTLKQIPPHQRLCVMRELSKLHEEHLLGTAGQLAIHYQEYPPRGECVVAVESIDFNYADLSLPEHVQYLIETFHLSLQEAIKIVAEIRGIPKRDVYHSIHC